MSNHSSFSSLPVIRNVSAAYFLSYVIALLIVIASVAGLFYQSGIYPSLELRKSFVSNDVVNLFIGLPILLGSMWLAQRGRWIGLLCWPGALFYTTYNYIAYAVAMPFAGLFVLYLGLVILSTYTLIGLLLRLNSTLIQRQLNGKVPERLAGGVLVGLGSLFFLRSAGQAAQALTGQLMLTGPELAVLVADLLTIPTWVVGGFLLWRRRAPGYIFGAGLLFQASMLFVGLLIFFIMQPILTATPFPAADFGVIFGMGLVCFIPFGLFVRGVIKVSR